MGNPEDVNENIINIQCGQNIGRDRFLRMLVAALYSRNETLLTRGTFRVKGDTVDIFLAYDEIMVRVMFWGDEIESIQFIDMETQMPTQRIEEFKIFPANIFVTSQSRLGEAIGQINVDLGTQVEMFRKENRPVEAKRLYERVTYDMEMMK